jgi:hypothetical protein
LGDDIPGAVKMILSGGQFRMLALVLLSGGGQVFAQEANGGSVPSKHDLAMRLRSKVSDLITLPFENDLQFGVGPARTTTNTLNIQPIVPFPLSGAWRIVTRTIVPVEYESPELAQGMPGKKGMGDVNLSCFLSPNFKANGWQWGIGPVINLPTSASPAFGYGRWAAGPTAVVVKQKGGLSYDMLVNHQWAFGKAGVGNGEVSATLIDPALSYTWNDGLSFDGEAQSTFDWIAHQWTIMARLGGGYVVNPGGIPVSLELDGLVYPARGPADPHWGIALVVTLILKK